MSWAEHQISDLGRVVTGKTPDTTNRAFYDGEFPFVTPSDIGFNHYICKSTGASVSDLARDRLPNQFIPQGSVIVTCIGNTIGKTAIAARDCLTNQQMNSIVVSSAHDPKFVYYLMCNNVEQIRSVGLGGGAAQPIINKSTFSALKVRLPDKSTQIRIANILSAYDNFIANNDRRIALLERSARLLFAEWFVYLRYPGHENDQIIDGLPEGWELKTLGEVSRFTYGKALKEENRIPGEIAVYGSSGEVGSHNKALVSAPGIVVGRKGNVGSVFWASKDFWPIDTAYYVDPAHVSLFVYHLLLAQTFSNSDAAVPGLNREYAHKKPVKWPSRNLRSDFDFQAEPIFSQRQILIASNRRLKQARDLLLPRLMDGRISL